MLELKRCPFCGGEAVLDGGDGYRWTVDCNQWAVDEKDPEDGCRCGIGYYDTEAGAIAAWNRRTPDYRALAQELAIPMLAFLRVLTCPECVKRGTFECRISCDERPFLSPCEMALVSLADAKDVGFEAQL